MTGNWRSAGLALLAGLAIWTGTGVARADNLLKFGLTGDISFIGDSQELSVVDLGLGSARGDVLGVQVAPVFCDGSPGETNGVQVALGWCRSQFMLFGIQVGGLAAINSEHLTPPDPGKQARSPLSVARPQSWDGAVQIGGFWADTQNNFMGLQTSLGVCRATRDLRGLQVGALGTICGGECRGLQLSLGPNWAAGDGGERWAMAGLQLSVLGNTTGRMRGLQIGLLNRAEELRGLQIGLANSCRKLYGLQIGLLNLCENSSPRALPLLNARF